MSQTLPNVPYKVPIIDQSGFLTPAWNGFFRYLFTRTGGSIALSNLELQNQTNTFTNQIVVMQTDITSLQTTVAQNATDFDQGTVL